LENDLLYRILSKNKIIYIHKERKFVVYLEIVKKQLVKMNPNNEVNFKLTLNKKDLKGIKYLECELKKYLII